MANEENLEENSIRGRVHKTICYDNPGSVKNLNPSTKLRDDLGYDSSDMSMLAFDIENEFPDIYIENGDLDEFCRLTTVEDVVNYVAQRLKK